MSRWAFLGEVSAGSLGQAEAYTIRKKSELGAQFTSRAKDRHQSNRNYSNDEGVFNDLGAVFFLDKSDQRRGKGFHGV